MPDLGAVRIGLLAVALGVGIASALTGTVELAVLPALGGVGVALALASMGRRGLEEGRWGTFALRLALAIALLGGALQLARVGLLGQTLAVLWAAGGIAIALGFLTPWAGLYAALALPLALRFDGSLAWAGLAVAALALVLAEDDTLALDARLARRGGLFPTVRHEVVLEPLRRR